MSGFGTAKNLKDWGYGKEHYSHSREFRSNVAAEAPFWSSVFEDCGFTQ